MLRVWEWGLAVKMLDFAFVGLGIMRNALRDGRLKGRDARVAVRGFTKYAIALKNGDIATNDTQAGRLESCLACPNIRTRAIAGAGKFKGGTVYHCGVPFEDNGVRGCGCLVALSVRGHDQSQPQPAGKTEVGTERCPAEKWTA